MELNAELLFEEELNAELLFAVWIAVKKEYWPTTWRCKYVNLFLNIFL